MHAGVGTALGGVMTMVGEPQNLIIAKSAGWNFADFFIRMLPVTLPVFIFGLLVCLLVEKFKLFGYGAQLPERVRQVLTEYDQQANAKRTKQEKMKLIVQAIIGVWLVLALALHLAEVGLVGLSVIILATSFCGITNEHSLGKAFQEALPFTALLTVFFAVVAVIIEQSLFTPIIQFVLQASPSAQLSLFYLFNGLLSSVSDNVFVGTVYINEARSAFEHGIVSLQQFELLAVAINTGTNLPSRGDTKRPGRFLVPADFGIGTTNSPFLWANGIYGFALYSSDDDCWPAGCRVFIGTDDRVADSGWMDQFATHHKRGCHPTLITCIMVGQPWG